ncbi:unnamed protein product [Polarella glacialis]|nr:unnamed protein product [Polarella glacialis]
MLEHMLAQLMVAAVDGCIELAHWPKDPDDESSLDGKPGSSCKFPLHETSSGPTVRKILIDQDIHMPQVFFNEIIGFRWDVVSALLGGLAPRLAQVRAPLFLELGVYDGATALRILEAHPEVRYLGADAWDETHYIGCETCTNEFCTNLMDTLIADLEPFGTRAQLINQTTIAAIQSLPDETVDLASVDANHFTEAVVADVIELTRVMKSGGVIVGHDFSPYWFETSLGVLWVANGFRRSVELSADGTWWFPDMGIETDEILAAWPASR